MKGGADLEARLESGIAPVSKCREKVWVPRWAGHYDRCVSVHGSLAKYIQGHNVTGRWEGVDIQGLLWMFHWCWLENWHCEAMERWEEGLSDEDLFLTPGWGREEEPLLDVSRVDLAGTFRVGESERDARDWMRGLEYSTRSREGVWRPDDDSGGGNGFSLGRHASERTWKAYLKGVEICKPGHQLLFERRRDLRDVAVEFLKGTVRLELTLRRSYLRRVGVPVVGDDLSVMMGHWDRLGKGDNVRINGEMAKEARALKSGPRDAYQLWERGEDVKEWFPRPTYYRHRRTILEATGVDIKIRRAAEGVIEVKELDYSREFLEGCYVAHEEFPGELTAEVQGA